MSINADDELLQDFLVEAGEILEQLAEQLVELERAPRDSDLLNAVFRGFHTVKGGAGFLGLDAMVEVCHRAEDVFNVLRQGERDVDATLMDAVLRVLDIVNEQFSQVSAGEALTNADAQLLAQLEAYAKPASEDANPGAPTQLSEGGGSGAAKSEGGDITDDEFEQLLDAMGETGGDGVASASEKASSAGQAPASEGGSDINDDEFEQLLDELHGPGKHGGVPACGADSPAGEVSDAGDTSAGSADEQITDDEFDSLLDELHGPGKAPAGDTEHSPVEAASAPGASATGPRDPTSEPAGRDQPVGAGAESGAKTEGTRQQARGGGETTVRVDTRRLDEIMNMVGELVLVRNRLATLKANMSNPEVSKAVANLDLVTSDLQTSVMKTRMQPVKKVFGRFPRVVRDLARNLQKEVELEMRGEDTDLDKNLVEALSDPMVHLVRNAVDHGIEAPDVREKAGKPRAGKVMLAAAQEGDHILLTILDDGAGMDPDALRRKAVEKGLMDADSAARLDDKDAYNLIFMPGFSTKSEISDVSGRGVGMDVVKTRIAQLNGTIEIDSEPGKGSKLSLKLPLTLAILPTLMIKVGMRAFALPLSSVSEIFHLDDTRTNVVDGQLCVQVRKRAMPLFYLREWLIRNPEENVAAETEQVVVTHVGNQKVGLVVNQVIGQEEVVIKPLGALLHGLAGFAGATITGDGRIALILDLPSLLSTHAGR